MIPRKKLDIGWADLAFGAWRCLRPADPERSREHVERLWSQAGDALACLSVRSGFDLLLQALAFPRGSEILVSAVTIRDMVRIVEEHGLVAVPVDLDMKSLSVRPEAVLRAAGDRAKAIVVAHLFGSRMPMEPVIRAAHSRGLLVIEDCAQAYAADGYCGHPESDVSMFSFGPIKTATALGGALLRIRRAELRAEMERRQLQWPRQGRFEYLLRVLKYAGLRFLSGELVYSAFVATCRLFGLDHDRIVAQAARGFAGGGFFSRIRRRPSCALLALLERRLRQPRAGAIAARGTVASSLASRIVGVPRPGETAQHHTHWVFPVLSRSPDALTVHLWRRGFDATRGATSLYVVPPPAAGSAFATHDASRVMQDVVYLPLDPAMREADIARLAHEVLQFEARAATAQTAMGRSTGAVGQPDLRRHEERIRWQR